MRDRLTPQVARAVLVTALACSVALPAALPMRHVDSAGKGDKRFKTVTRTFSNQDAITIAGPADAGPADPFPSRIEVSGLRKGKIEDVNLTLRGLEHQLIEDVDILLVAPNGRDAMVFSDVGGNAQSIDQSVTLDDEAPAPLPANELIAGRTFQPFDDEPGADFGDAGEPEPSGAVALSTFDGGRPNGAWKLFVDDDVAGGKGKIAKGWTLTITATIARKKR